MDIVDAHWEKRNLGKTTIEVNVGQDDTTEAIRAALAGVNAQYVVVKLPVGKVDSLLALQSDGYRFIEMMSVCFHDGDLPPLSPVQRRMLDTLSCSDATPEDLGLILAGVEQGMFEDDRVSLDPHFSATQAAARYRGWISDEVAAGSSVIAIRMRGAVVGFFVLKARDAEGEYFASLGGILPRYQNIGIGYFMNYLEIVEARRRGGKRVYTAFSSNNPKITAVHFSMGCKIFRQYYVLVRHNNLN
ncbi:MAG: hypothetical protein ING32_12485 [Curvibacter sp.]|jgi:hypothetical protein|nr:hypothetical protein [Curvibacter sp.]